MLLEPRKRKYRREFRGKIKGKATRGTELSFGDFGLRALEGGWIKARQIEAARKAISYFIKGKGKLWIRIFPHKPVTSKPSGAPMGKGKGPVDHHVAPVRKGKILFEVSGPQELALEGLRRAGHKLPVKTEIVEQQSANSKQQAAGS